jgi:hypothetical protein
VLKFNYILLLFVVLNCKPSSLKNYKDSCEEINDLMYEQEESWNKENIEDFMKKYWKNDSLIFICKSGLIMVGTKLLATIKSPIHLKI